MRLLRKFCAWKDAQLDTWPKPDYYLILLEVVFGLILLVMVCGFFLVFTFAR